ncbi:hypothetical protein G7067_05450 [Leucobacter insecticola]|uniref:DUF7617 domain-containing protein n=1 Tax=Leucobacter insecticola TaxID=2714934 RepID=A0A6G8FI71_9MICO|nr:hypothetical protein [Leucobacter insecticola]QIM15993.1 hypothetical protein G7067_05450 [Leucobacter insecticola]
MQKSVRRIGTAIFAALVALTSFFTVAPAALAEGETSTVQMEFGATGLTTQKSGAPFTALFSFSCASPTAASCDDAVITIPWPDDPDPALGGSGIASWTATVNSDVPGLVDAAVEKDTAGRQWVIRVKQPILSDGSAVGIQLTFNSPNVTTPDGFQFPVQPTVSGSNFSAVTAAPALYTVTATPAVRITKTLPSTPTPGGALRWQVFMAEASTGTVGSLGTIPGTRKIVDVLPPEVDFVSLEPAGVPHTYDAATRTLTIETTESTNGSKYYYINARVKDSVADKTPIANTATISYQLVGTGAVESKPSTVTKNVSSTVSVGSLLSKSALGNLPTGLSGSTSLQTGFVTEAVSNKEVRYTLSIKQDDNPIDWSLTDVLPCLTSTVPGGILSSGSASATCSDPAFHVSRIAVGSDPAFPSAPAGTDTGKTLTLLYVDDTSEMKPLLIGQDVLPKAGGQISRITIEGSHEGGNSWANYYVYGTIDASLEGRTEVQQLRNTVWGKAAYAGTPMPVSYGNGSSVTGYILRGYTAAAVTAAPTVSTTPTGGAVSMGITSGFVTSDPALEGKARTVWVLPEGPFNWSLGTTPIASGNDWQGTGRTFAKLNGAATFSSFRLAGNSGAEAGVYPYDVYTGYEGGTTFQTCGSTPDGAVAAANDIFVDTTGIIGPVGVPTTICHQTGYIVVTGPIPSSTTTKMVRGGEETAWVGSPGTSAVAADGTGSADFKVTWANTGSAALQDVTLYDMLPRIGDTYTVGNQASRGSTMTPSLTAVTVPSGWTVAYSTAANPCRPEVMATNPGCDPTWSTTAPAQLGTVTGLRFTKASSSPVGTVAEFIVSMNAADFTSADKVAWNTVSTRAYVAGTTPTPIAPTEAPKVGFGLVQTPDISVVKEVCTTTTACAEDAAVGGGGWADSATVAYDGTVNWRITVTNTGQTALTDVAISDPLVSDCVATIGDLAVGAHASKTCASTGLRAALTNQATATGVGLGVTVTDSDTASVTVGAKPFSNVGIVKQVCDATENTCDVNAADDASEWATSASLPFEGTAKWRVIVQNLGYTTLTNVVVQDAANTACAATIDTLAPLAFQRLGCENADLAASMTNTATVTATPPYGDPALTGSATATATVAEATPAVTLVKEICDADDCDPDAPIGSDGWSDTSTKPYFDSATWRLTAKNTGESDLASVSISDPLVSGCALDPTQTLARGASISVTCDSDELTASFTNEASVSATDVNGATASDTASADVVVEEKPTSGVELVIESCNPAVGSCDPDAPVGESGWSSSTTVPFEGDGVWRVTVKNTGDTELSKVVVENPAYPDCAFTLPTLAAGASGSQLCTVEAVDGTVTSTATVTATPPYGDADLTDESTADIVSVDPLVQIGVEKEVCSTGNDCDPNAEPLTGGWVKAAALEPGSEPFWRIIVTNEGQVPLTDVMVDDPALEDCAATFAEMLPGERQVITCTGAAAFESAGGTVTATGTNPRGGATATVSADSEATVTVRDFATAVTVVKEACVVAPGSDCLQNGTGWTAHANGAFGSELWWRITVTNSGDTDITDVVVTDPKLPTADFTVARLAPGASQSTVVSAGSWQILDPNAPEAKNTASVTAVSITGEDLTDSAFAIGTVDPQGADTDGTDASGSGAGAGAAGAGLALTGGTLPVIAIGAGALLVLAGGVVFALRLVRRRRDADPAEG